ncbi:hypothetical protein VCHA49P382_110005 [Vibrio chagasii]|nr:hypothetical protein VCHA49P382_110005 [Vibrio chagasii]
MVNSYITNDSRVICNTFYFYYALDLVGTVVCRDIALAHPFRGLYRACVACRILKIG